MTWPDGATGGNSKKPRQLSNQRGGELRDWISVSCPPASSAHMEAKRQQAKGAQHDAGGLGHDLDDDVIVAELTVVVGRSHQEFQGDQVRPPRAKDERLEIDVRAFLSEAGETCGADAVTVVQASLATASELLTQEQAFPDCDSAIRFDQLEADFYVVSLQTRRADGSEGPSADCGAQVLPATVSVADCILL